MKETKKKYIQGYPMAKIKPYAKNPRINDHAVPALCASIEDFGNNDPIQITPEGIILAGHTRYKALKKMGFTTADVYVIDGLNDEEQKAYRLAHNKVGEIAEWDAPMVMEELGGIEHIDMEELGFDEGQTIEGFGEEFVLPDGDRPDGCTMSFTLSSEQAEIVRQALDRIDETDYSDMGNTNKNGNKLTGVCSQWLVQRT